MAVLLKNLDESVELDFNRYAADQKEVASKIASYGAVGSIAGVFLGNFFSVNIIYSGISGFLVGAAVGKYSYDLAKKNKNKETSGKSKQN
jgi:hypothetical protein